MIIIWSIIAFILGSIPFSLLIGHYALKVDIRDYGDGNPGSTNVLRAGGIKWFILAMLLDAFKACIPVGIAYWALGIADWSIVPIALAPIFGHAFSPFLNFRGGKAVASTFGIWAALTIWEIPTVLGIMLVYWSKSLNVDGWVVISAMLSVLLYLMIQQASPSILAVWVGNFLILVYKHRSELTKVPDIKRWLPILLAGSKSK